MKLLSAMLNSVCIVWENAFTIWIGVEMYFKWIEGYKKIQLTQVQRTKLKFLNRLKFSE